MSTWVDAEKITYWSGLVTVHVSETTLAYVAKLLKKPIVRLKDDLYVFDGGTEYKASVKGHV